MHETVKVAISLPKSLLSAADAASQRAGLSRSEFFRDAVEVALRAEQERLDDEAYIRSYTERPEDDDEVELIQRLGRKALERAGWS